MKIARKASELLERNPKLRLIKSRSDAMTYNYLIGGKPCRLIENYPQSNPIPVQETLKRTPSNNSGSLPYKVGVQWVESFSLKEKSFTQLLDDAKSPIGRTFYELYSEAQQRKEKPLIGTTRWMIQT